MTWQITDGNVCIKLFINFTTKPLAKSTQLLSLHQLNIRESGSTTRHTKAQYLHDWAKGVPISCALRDALTSKPSIGILEMVARQFSTTSHVE